jgi:hypothetical protein
MDEEYARLDQEDTALKVESMSKEIVVLDKQLQERKAEAEW